MTTAPRVDELPSLAAWLLYLRSDVGISLMTRVAATDLDAFGEFYDLTAARVLAVIRSVIPDPELSEELMTEIFLEFWRTAPARASSFEPLRSVILFARYRAEERFTELTARR